MPLVVVTILEVPSAANKASAELWKCRGCGKRGKPKTGFPLSHRLGFLFKKATTQAAGGLSPAPARRRSAPLQPTTSTNSVTFPIGATRPGEIVVVNPKESPDKQTNFRSCNEFAIASLTQTRAVWPLNRAANIVERIAKAPATARQLRAWECAAGETAGAAGWVLRSTSILT